MRSELAIPRASAAPPVRQGSHAPRALAPAPRAKAWICPPFPPSSVLPQALQREVGALGEALGRSVLRAEGPRVYAAVEGIRRLALAGRSRAPDEHAHAALESAVASLSPRERACVVRAFADFFHLVNLAERRSRARAVQGGAQPDSLQPDSLEGALKRLSKSGGPKVRSALRRLEINPVLTAHPTETRSPGLRAAIDRVGEVLDAARGQVGVPPRLQQAVDALWATSNLRRRAPTPVEEADLLIGAFRKTLFAAVPALYRGAARAAAAQGAEGASRPFVRLSSWIGSDRDGNPNVTAKVMAEVAGRQRRAVLEALCGSAEQTAQRVPPEAAPPLRRIAGRLRATLTRGPGAYEGPQALVAELSSVLRTLDGTGAGEGAREGLQDLLWQAQTFGFHLATLEVRQHARVHAQVIDELLPGASRDASALDRLARQGWPPGTAPSSKRAEEVLETFRAMRSLQAAHGQDVCGPYIISGCERAEDVLAVAALQRLACGDQGPRMTVVPLFESVADLQKAAQVMEAAFALPAGRAALRRPDGGVEVMLGYSDSAKDAGFAAAQVALYRAQGELSAWAHRQGVDLVLFQGRGGTVPRGGGPVELVLATQPEGALAGRIKLTEQGEVIAARYSDPVIARRHLEQLSHAALLSHPQQAQAPTLPPVLAQLADRSQAAYRALVEADGFEEFVARVSPLGAIGSLKVGSRPAKRHARGGLKDLRAIPWTAAWIQNRTQLCGWFGLGSALAPELRTAEGASALRALYRREPLFRAILDSAERSLATADPHIARRYLDRGRRPELKARILEEMERTRDAILAVKGSAQLLAGSPWLAGSIALRTPYVDALSHLQLKLLEDVDKAPDAGSRREAEHALQLTVHGLAAALHGAG